MAVWLSLGFIATVVAVWLDHKSGANKIQDFAIKDYFQCLACVSLGGLFFWIALVELNTEFKWIKKSLNKLTGFFVPVGNAIDAFWNWKPFKREQHDRKGN